jgi:circadian clock protein KaiB
MTTAHSPPTGVPVSHAITRYTLRLYVTGFSPRSMRAISNTRRICEKYLNGRYDLELVDIAQHQDRAGSEQIIAAPTLIKTSPLPIRRFIGDMSQTERILAGLGIGLTQPQPLCP